MDLKFECMYVIRLYRMDSMVLSVRSMTVLVVSMAMTLPWVSALQSTVRLGMQ